MMPKRLEKEDYTVGWICALAIPELKASRLLFDGEEHENVTLDRRTSHQYVYGEMNGHNVVMGCLPASQMGKASAAAVANEMSLTFPRLQFTLIVGIGGAVPMPNDIRLGDVVVSLPDLSRQHSGVVQYDFGKAMHDGKFVMTGQLNQPPTTVLSGISKVRSISPGDDDFWANLQHYSKDSYWNRGLDDHLFAATYEHAEGRPTCSECDPDEEIIRPTRRTEIPNVHYGLIASGDQVIKDAMKRDALSEQYRGILCFEMEAAGIANILPCLVIRGICDYCDSHKNKVWQPYAAAAAAAWGKGLLGNIAPIQLQGRRHIRQEGGRKTAQDGWMQRFVGQLTATKRSVDDAWRLIDQISSYEPRKVLNRLSRKRSPGTTEWLSNAPAFSDWESDDTVSRMLWLSGKVGSGKTVAMTAAVHHLLAKTQSHHKTQVLHHFFQYPETKAVDLFRSLSRQLLQLHMDQKRHCATELVNDLVMHFGACNGNPDLNDIVEDILLPLTYEFESLVVCIDGIETSDVREQEGVCSGLFKLIDERSKREKHTRILVAGENESKLAVLLPADTLRIRLEQGFILDDINKYIDARLQKQSHPRQLFHDANLRARLKEALLQRADNMFLWVHLQLEEIMHNCTTALEVDMTLQDLPKTLQGLYMRCLKRKVDDKLLYSLRDMLALDGRTGDVERNRRPDPESILRSGVSLLTLGEPDMLLEPAHHTVRQFLFSSLLCDSLANEIEFPSALHDQLTMSLRDTELEIGQFCLRHIEARTRIEIDVRHTVQAPPVIGMIPQFVQKGLHLGQRRTIAPAFHNPRRTKPHTTSFLQYAIETWLLHTKQFTATTPSWDKFEH